MKKLLNNKRHSQAEGLGIQENREECYEINY